MVHALKLAREVLRPGGLLIDLRPWCTEAPLEVGSKGSFELAGMVDSSLNKRLDDAADAAVEEVKREEIFESIHREEFDCAYYWNSYRGMIEDFEGKWKGDVRLPEEVARRAKMLYRKHLRRARLRLWLRTKLEVLERR
jgi:hypothetical protein